MKTFYWTFAALVLSVTLAISPATAQQPVSPQQNLTCTQQIGSGTFNDVLVPSNATCSLFDLGVQGSISV
jgi:hypothetical protein